MLSGAHVRSLVVVFPHGNTVWPIFVSGNGFGEGDANCIAELLKVSPYKYVMESVLELTMVVLLYKFMANRLQIVNITTNNCDLFISLL